VALPWAIGIIFFLFSARADRAIAARQQRTYGVVKTHEPANHDRYGYDFTVNGEAYNGWQIPTRSELRIGEKVLVYYDPRDPRTSSLSSFAEGSDRAIGPVFFMTVGIVAIAAYIFLRRRNSPG